MRYLLVGGLNTLAGYCIGVGIYEICNSYISIVLIGVITNIFSITFSFVTYKLFVFKTSRGWISEYLKAYVVYGGVAAFGIFALWVFIDRLGISIWISQALVILVTVVVSYFGHAKFTFKRSQKFPSKFYPNLSITRTSDR
jgi:putative flippase GtrA